MERTRGIRVRSRNKLRKNVREQGLPSLSRMLAEFKNGETVAVKIEPSVHKGMPHHRYQGITGKIIGKRGAGFLVEIRDGKKVKTIISRGVHLRRIK